MTIKQYITLLREGVRAHRSNQGGFRAHIRKSAAS